MKHPGLRTLAAVAIAACALAVGAIRPAHAKDDVPAIVGTTPAERVASARGLAQTNPDGLAHALIALGDTKPKKEELAGTLDFLVEYVVGEPARVLRLLAVDSANRIDAAGAAARLRTYAVPDDALKAALSAEALGYVGGKDDVEPLLALARLPRLDITVPAIRSLARLGEKSSVDELVEIALTHSRAEIADECAWALQDILKKPKTVLAKLKKGAGKDEAKEIRYETILAILEDDAAPVHVWTDKTLEKLRKLALEAPAEVAINSTVSQRTEKIQSAVKWLRENLPGDEYTLRVGAASVDFPLKENAVGFLDREARAVGVPIGLKGVSYLSQSDGQLAYHILRSAVVLLEHATDNPTWGRRGWHNAVFDTYEVCKAGGLYSVADGVSRDGLLDQIYSLQSPPWRGE